MKKVIDKTRSRRPIMEEDETDFHNTRKRIDNIKRAIEKLERHIEIKENCKEYMTLVRESHERMMEIALKRMSHDVNDLPWHASVVGQFNERLRLTEELIKAKSSLIERRRLLDRVNKQFTRLAKKLNLTGENNEF